MTKNQTQKKSPVQHMLQWTCCLLILLGLWTTDVNAQAAYSNNFDVNATGWTGNIIRTTETTACGTPSMRRNLYSSVTTGNMVSPSCGTSNGALATLSYQYKVANWSANTVGTPNPWGSFNVQYGATATGPWTTFQTINSGNHIVSGTCSTVVVTFTPPAGALFIKWDAFWSAGDYYINFDNVTVSQAAGSPCTTPSPGNTLSSANPVCSGASFTLTMQNSTPGSGVSYQWQSSPDNTTWTNFGGGLASQATTQSVATYYRCEVTCSTGPSVVASNSLLVTMNTFNNCYCVGTANCAGGDHITSVNFDAGAINNPSGVCLGSGGNSAYSNYTAMSANVTSGNTYAISVSVANGGTEYASVWIDYNHSGTFDAAEYTSIPLTLATTWNGTANITIDPLALTGTTGMRVRSRYSTAITSADACTAFSYGETEDYSLVIAAPVPCAGTPAPGNTVASSTSLCAGGTSNLSLQFATSGTGVTYAWQSSPDNATWTNTGGTLSTYTTAPLGSDTYFRCEVTCSSGPAIGYSNSQLISIVPAPVGGTASGPSSGLTYQNLVYNVTGYTGSLQWQVSTDNITFNDIVSATTSTLNATVNGAGTYYIRCKAYNAGCTDAFSNVITLVVTVAGDNVCTPNALVLGNNGPYTNIGATSEAGEVTPPGTGCNTQTGWCGTGYPINSVWFSFTAPASGRVSVRLNPNYTLWDSEFAIYSVEDCGDFSSFSLIAANDDSASSPYNSYITPVCLTPGATYYLLVDGYSTSTNGTWGILLQDAGYLNANTSTISGVMSTCAPSDGSVTMNFAGTGPWTYSLTDGTNTMDGSSATTPYTQNVPCGSNGAHTWTYTYVMDGACAQTNSGSATVNTSSAPVTVNVPNPPIAGLPAAACNGSSAAISTSSVALATYYTWDGPAGCSFNASGNPYVSATNSVNISFGAPAGSGYYIGVQASNGCGSSLRRTQWVRGTVNVPASVSPTLVGQTIYCANTLGATFTTPAVVGATSYLWSITGDATVSGTGTTATVDFGPTWTGGTLCVAAQTSCFTSATKCLVLTYAPATVGAMSGTFTTCIGQSVLYSVPAQVGIASYNWTLPAGASGSSTSNSINVTFNPGFIGGNISVTATSICGVTSSARTTTIYLGVPTQPASITGPSSGVCSQTVIYSCPNQAGVTFNWTVPNGTINSGQGSNAISVTFGTFAGASTVSVTASNACGSSPARTKTVNGYPSQPGAITSIPASWCANAAGVEFDVDVTNMSGSYTLSWLYPNATVATYVLGGGNSTSLIMNWITGSGPVNVTASNACGNSTRSSTQANSCREGEEVVSAASGAINVYPNPTSGNVNVEFSSVTKGNAHVTVQDISGRTIVSQDITVVEGLNKTQVDLSSVSKGIYMMNVNSAQGTSKVKIVVE